jgi:fatty acid synthase subunit alpha
VRSFVAAVMSAGYHIELAGGGHYSKEALRAKIDKIMKFTELVKVLLSILFF